MKRASVVLVAMTVLVGLAGCRTPEQRAQAVAAKREAQEAAFNASVPADSPLAQISLGMSESEVISILGQPASQDGHITGKAFIPFNFAGRDTMRMVFYYAGIGRVEFSAGSWGQRNGAILLIHDPSEPGHRP